METLQINPAKMNEFINSEAFKQIENKIVQDVVSEATNTARKELELFKFEILYPLIVSKKEREEIEEFIDVLRNKKWREALKKAGGDEEKALMLM